MVFCRQTRSSGGAGVEGSYGPSQPLEQSSSGNAQDPSDPKPHITRSSGGAGVEGTYGPDDALKTSKAGASSTQSASQCSQQQPQQPKEDKPPSGDQRMQSGDAASAEEALPDPMVAADDGSQPHEASAGLQGRMSVGADGGRGTRSKL